MSQEPVRQRVLVVDDEQEVLNVTSQMLQRLGYDVIRAASGPEALKKLADSGQKLDLLISDLIMPGMTGRMLADALAARIEDLPVIFMSGHIDDARAVQTENLNFLRKPFRADELRSVVQAALSRARKND